MSSNPMNSNQSPCYFLQLPRELRDTIYTYTLSEPQDLHFRHDNDIGRLYLKKPLLVAHKNKRGIQKRVRTPWEANQLRYVSRQFYRETRGLGIYFNDIVFQNVADAFFFFSNCPRSYLQGRRAFHIELTPFSETPFPRAKFPPIAYDLLRFCESHSNITIWAPTELLAQTNPSLVTNAIYWQARYRRPEDVVMLKTFATDPLKYATMAEWVAMRPMGLNVPLNFRLVPSDGPFSEATFLKSWLRRWPYTEGDWDGWVSAIRDIYANGI